MKRALWIGIPVLLVAVLVTLGIVKSKEKVPLEVTVAEVTQGDFERVVSGSGTVEARVYTLAFTRVGRVERVLVKEGDTVGKGAVLAALSTTRETEDLQAARDRLSALQASLRTHADEAHANRQKVEIQLTETRRKLALTRRLLSAGAAASDEADTLARQERSLLADLRAQDAGTRSRREDLGAQIAATQAEIRGTERALRESRLVAPVAGRIASVDFRIGETAQGAVKLVEAHSLRVKARMSEADAMGIAIGQPARIELDADLDHPLRATVERLGVVADVQGTGGSATLTVTLRFTDPRAETVARHGYSVTARITTQTLPKTIQVPLECLVDEEKAGEKTYAVWVLDKKAMTVAKRAITVQTRNLTRAVVTGVTSGMSVLSLPAETLKNGDIVRLPKPKPEKK
jgi:multidrug efflux pump subunit AcrA (membrane-fusion protein)